VAEYDGASGADTLDQTAFNLPDGGLIDGKASDDLLRT
jgi:hypothetical protein